MKKVLLRTFLLTLFAVLINGMRYFSMANNFNQEIVLIIGILSLAAAVPILLGYFLANVSLRSSNPIIVVAKVVLFILNGLLIIGTTLLTVYISFEETDVLISFPYLVAGYYTYYETIKLVRQPPNPEAQGLSDDDVLDEFFIDSE